MTDIAKVIGDLLEERQDLRAATLGDLLDEGANIDEVIRRVAEIDDIEADLGGDLEALDGETIIADSDFEDYAMESARDTLGVDFDQWPFTSIDWESAAEDLQSDYTSFEFEGETYWYRA